MADSLENKLPDAAKIFVKNESNSHKKEKVARTHLPFCTLFSLNLTNMSWPFREFVKSAKMAFPLRFSCWQHGFDSVFQVIFMEACKRKMTTLVVKGF